MEIKDDMENEIIEKTLTLRQYREFIMTVVKEPSIPHLLHSLYYLNSFYVTQFDLPDMIPKNRIKDELLNMAEIWEEITDDFTTATMDERMHYFNSDLRSRMRVRCKVRKEVHAPKPVPVLLVSRARQPVHQVVELQLEEEVILDAPVIVRHLAPVILPVPDVQLVHAPRSLFKFRNTVIYNTKDTNQCEIYVEEKTKRLKMSGVVCFCYIRIKFLQQKMRKLREVININEMAGGRDEITRSEVKIMKLMHLTLHHRLQRTLFGGVIKYSHKEQDRIMDKHLSINTNIIKHMNINVIASPSVFKESNEAPKNLGYKIMINTRRIVMEDMQTLTEVEIMRASLKVLKYFIKISERNYFRRHTLVSRMICLKILSELTSQYRFYSEDYDDLLSMEEIVLLFRRVYGFRF
jgi:hypothetical protein